MMIPLSPPNKSMLCCQEASSALEARVFSVLWELEGSHSLTSSLFTLTGNIMTKTDELKIRIVEREDLLRYFVKYQMPFTESGYRFLCNELKDWKDELADLETNEFKETYKFIRNN